MTEDGRYAYASAELRELVRCGCGRVRNPDEDQALSILAPLALQAMPGVASVAALEHYETPRICRHCGVVYMLPKPSAPRRTT
jgi:hypothetical protein